jgi:hypothetical protein
MRFGWEIQKERDYCEDQDISVWINIKRYLRETERCVMDWIYLAHNRDQRRILVNLY